MRFRQSGKFRAPPFFSCFSRLTADHKIIASSSPTEKGEALPLLLAEN